MIRKSGKKAAFISSYMPRKYGIATFTANLTVNIKSASERGFEKSRTVIISGQ